MNKFKFYFILLSTLIVLFSCNKNEDDIVTVPLRDFGEQFKKDSIAIDTYLKGHYLNSEIADQIDNINSADLIKKIPENGTQASIMSLLNSPTFPKLLLKKVEKHDITYSVYYLQLREGSTTDKPCPYDEVLVTYRGTSLKSGTETLTNGSQAAVVNETEFENSPISSLFSLSAVISGWQEVFPLFGKGTFDEPATGNGPNVFANYGAGIMFLPSGLAYYNGSRTNIPSYSPLVFSFKLFNFKQVDNDNDGIMSADEIIRNADGTFTLTDTDDDGFPDYRDFDDDNDGFPTINERKKVDGTYYEFNLIPDCSGNDDNPLRIKKHLDKNCH